MFFLTAEKLSKSDTDNSYDVYDAHECTTESTCPPAEAEAPPACTTTDACRAAPAPQPEVFGAPASATFSGPGNVGPAPPAVEAETPDRRRTQGETPEDRPQRVP